MAHSPRDFDNIEQDPSPFSLSEDTNSDSRRTAARALSLPSNRHAERRSREVSILSSGGEASESDLE